MSEKTNKHRLPKGVLPTHYDLHFWPDLTRSEEPQTFHGLAFIDIRVLKPTKKIVLNAAELAIRSVEFVSTSRENSEAKIPLQIKLDAAREQMTIFFRKDLPVGPALLSINFFGTHNDNLVGFYRSRYTAQNGEERSLVTTQFEATDARRAFPCWDEPDIKATFKVVLHDIPEHLATISNMPIENEIKNPRAHQKYVVFEKTPLMSTYLLAFVVGEFENVATKTKHGTDVRVWTLPGKTEQGKFALDVATRSLEYLTEYFGISYPLPKLDNIAAPDFASGAMENWGAITYRETALLVDPVLSAETARQRVACVVAHEVAHQWFGNLVTMKWWNDLWLNEGFASWMGDKIVDALFPDWDMWTIFTADDTMSGLALDGLINTHPIEVPVSDPKEIGEVFDAISYSKGASIIRMLESFLGEEKFRDGLRRYLNGHLYGNARTEDLWRALEESSGEPVREMMNAWTKQPGHPVINVQIKSSENGVRAEISQTRFIYDSETSLDDEASHLWPVPVRLKTSSGREIIEFVRTRGTTIELDAEILHEKFWLKINPDHAGFHRTNYDKEGWRRLMPAIESLALPPRDRLGLQSDAYALQKAGHLPATQFLELVPFYKNETEFAVWSELAGHLGGFESLLANESFSEEFRDFAREAFGKIASHMGWEKRSGERHIDIMLRGLALGASGFYGNTEVIDEAKKRFADLLSSGNINPNIRNVVYGIAAREGGAEEYNALVSLYKKAALQEEKVQILRALGNFKDRNLVLQTLEFSLSSDVRSQDLIFVIAGAASNSETRELTWNFVKKNWSELMKRLSGSKWLIRNVIEVTTSGFSTPEHAEEVRKFFTENPVPEATRTIEQALERIRLNAKWLERNRKDLKEWFSEK